MLERREEELNGQTASRARELNQAARPSQSRLLVELVVWEGQLNWPIDRSTHRPTFTVSSSSLIVPTFHRSLFSLSSALSTSILIAAYLSARSPFQSLSNHHHGRLRYRRLHLQTTSKAAARRSTPPRDLREDQRGPHAREQCRPHCCTRYRRRRYTWVSPSFARVRTNRLASPRIHRRVEESTRSSLMSSSSLP